MMASRTIRIAQWLYSALIGAIVFGIPCRVARPDDSEEDPVTVKLSQAQTIDDLKKLLPDLPEMLTEQHLTALRGLDRRLKYDSRCSQNPVGRELLVRLALSGDTTSLDYVRQVFDGFPHRRADAAVAFARFAAERQRRPADWQILVRSLPVIEGDDAVLVLDSLVTFRQVATRTEWLRHVILIGRRLGEPKCGAAIRLLQHWTREKHGEDENSLKTLAEWQSWFEMKYPDSPPAQLTTDPPNARHSTKALLAVLQTSSPQADTSPEAVARRAKSVKNGAIVFEKASCAKCHRFGELGEKVGPELSTVSQRLHRKEILESILFPSQVVPDEYITQTVTTKGGTTITGMVHMAPKEYTVLQINGEKAVISRDDVQSIEPKRGSAMPAGLLDKFETAEVVDLFEYLDGDKK